jgi:Flagellar FliJ protein.
MRKENGKSKRFNYRLDPVLKARSLFKKQQQETVIRAQRAQAEALKKETELKALQQQAYADLRSKMSTGQTLDFTGIQLRKAHLDKVGQWVTDQVQKREAADKTLASERQVLLKRAQDEKVIEKDKAHRRVLWTKAVRREETKQLDDLSTGRFSRAS